MSAVADHALVNPTLQTSTSNDTTNSTTTSDNYNYNTTIHNTHTNNNTVYDHPFNIRHINGSTYITPRIINETWTELKIGVLLPFHQKSDPWTQRLTLSGASAIRMAVNEINSQQLIPNAYVTLIERDSFPKDVNGQAGITQAVFATVSLIQEGVIGLIGDISSSWTSLSALMTSTLQIPQCSFSAVATSLSDKTQYSYFFRTVSTKLLYSDAALDFIVSQGWPSIGILYADDDIGQQLSESLIMKSKLQGVHVQAYQKFYEDGPQSNIHSSIDILMNTGVQIIIVAAEGESQLAAFTVASNMGHINNNTVWISMGKITNELYNGVQQFNTQMEHRISSTTTTSNISPTNNNNNSKTNKNDTDAISFIAKTTPHLQSISFNETFSGGIFLLDSTLDLHGYKPYDEFNEKWSRLDPNIYPYGGQTGLTSNEGLAYSCMMVMAHGFNQVLYNATNMAEALKKLSVGQMGDYLTPPTFNTSFIGPAGPMLFDQNGDSMASNFRIYNIQQGNEIEIGQVLAGNLTLTSNPVYHDGTHVPPSGVPTRILLNPGFTSPVSIIITIVAGLGTFFALFTMAIVLIFRKRQVFKASSPLFCVLELVGFIFSYAAVFFYANFRSKFECIMIPVTFHIGLALVLANLIAKNYRIYRIFNNIFVTKTIVTDWQLLKFSGGIMLIVLTLLISWLASSQIVPIKVPVSNSAYYIKCSFQGPGSTVFTTLLTIVPAAQLAFATFLSIKTRAVGKSYSKYSEYKQIGISVYNILFSALVGFVVFSVPTTDYYTKHYLTLTIVVWAITSSMLVLFLPKLHIFFFQKGKNNSSGKRPDISGRVVQTNATTTTTTTTATSSTLTSHHGDMETKSRELMSINRFLASPNAIDPDLIGSQKQQQKKSNDSINSSSDNYSNASTIKNTNVSTTVFEAHEARMPVQVVFRYFPFLSAWDMKHVFLFPRVGYFSFFSEKSQKGRIFGYNRATIESSKQNTYILRVHGTNVFDVLIQVANFQELESWLGWFNTQKNTTPSLKSGGSSSSSNTTTLTSSSAMTTCLTSPTHSNKSMDITLSKKKYVRSDSGLSARQQLLSESNRQESNMTLETIENEGPLVTPSTEDFNNSNQVPHHVLSSSSTTSISPTPLTIPETHSNHNTILNQWSFTLSPTTMENNNDNNDNNNESENIPLHNIRKK